MFENFLNAQQLWASPMEQMMGAIESPEVSQVFWEILAGLVAVFLVVHMATQDAHIEALEQKLAGFTAYTAYGQFISCPAGTEVQFFYMYRSGGQGWYVKNQNIFTQDKVKCHEDSFPEGAVEVYKAYMNQYRPYCQCKTPFANI